MGVVWSLWFTHQPKEYRVIYVKKKGKFTPIAWPAHFDDLIRVVKTVFPDHAEELSSKEENLCFVFRDATGVEMHVYEDNQFQALLPICESLGHQQQIGVYYCLLLQVTLRTKL